MDTITHAIVGTLAGKAFFAGCDLPARPSSIERSVSGSDSIARTGIFACAIGAIFPDIDVFAGPIAGNPIAILEWHRNISHSLVLLPLWAVLLAALSVPSLGWLRWKSVSFARLTGIYAFGLASHVFLDLITNFGTMVWSPIQYSRVAWDWLYIVDLTLTGLALVPQLIAWCYRDPRKFNVRAIVIWITVSMAALGAYFLAASVGASFSIWVVGIVSALVAACIFVPALRATGFGWRRATWYRAGFGLACIYVSLAAAAHHKALAYTKQFAAQQRLPANELAALPLPPTATHWASVISTPDGVWRRTFYLPGATIERTEYFPNAQRDPHVQAAMNLPDVRVYLWFARFPVWKVLQSEGQTIAEVSDVRFYRMNREIPTDPKQKPSEEHDARFLEARRGSNGFAYDVLFDAEGHVLSSGFRKEGP